MKLTLRKILNLNILVLIVLIFSKIWNYMYLNKMAKILYNQTGTRIGANLTNLYLQASNDILIAIPDFSVYIIAVGILMNLILYIVVLKKRNN